MRIAICASAAALVLACALPASARNEFENGFKDELGRIAAQQAVSGGQNLITALFSAYWQAQSRAPQPTPWEYRSRAPEYERDHGHHRDRLHDPRMGHYDHSHEPFGYHCHP